VLAPAPVALATLLAAIVSLPADTRARSQRPRIDIIGAVFADRRNAPCLYTLVEAERGLAVFRCDAPLIRRRGGCSSRLRSLRSNAHSGPLIRSWHHALVDARRANSRDGAVGRIGFQFIATLYMSSARLVVAETDSRICRSEPSACAVAAYPAARQGGSVCRRGEAGSPAFVFGYAACSCRSGLHSSYAGRDAADVAALRAGRGLGYYGPAKPRRGRA